MTVLTELEAAHERLIDEQMRLMASARSTDDQRSAFKELARLHVMRSPETIAKMEAKLGIRRLGLTAI